jgi:hypothetical protein
MQGLWVLVDAPGAPFKPKVKLEDRRELKLSFSLSPLYAVCQPYPSRPAMAVVLMCGCVGT